MRRENGFFFGAFLRDISDRRERDDQLRRAKETAEAATRAKSEFLANMSHELRTPLNGVIGYAQLLQRDRTLSGSQQEALDAISQVRRAPARPDQRRARPVEDRGRLRRNRSRRHRPGATDDATCGMCVGDSARRKGVVLSMVAAGDVPRRVVLDGRHLRQVLLNLLGNAIKFTARRRGAAGHRVGEDGRLAFEVIDTGVGIEPEALDAKSSKRSRRPRPARRPAAPGWALPSASTCCGRWASELQVESTPGLGSRFFFSLPLLPAPDESGTTARSGLEPALDARLAPGQHVTALVVDDSTVSRRILASLLESAGFSVITATGGRRRHRRWPRSTGRT